MKPTDVTIAEPLSVRHLRSRSITGVDLLRAEDASLLLQLFAVVAFAMLTAMGAQIRIYLWEVPITLQTLAVYGSGLFLGWRNGFLAQALYILLGLFLPVFAGDGYGIAYLTGAASTGYLLAFPVVALVVGVISARWNTLAGSTLCMVIGSILLFGSGVVWLHFALGHQSWNESLVIGWFRFIPIDLAKIMLVGLLYSGMRFASRK